MSTDTDTGMDVAEPVDPTEERLDNPGYEIFIAVLSILSIVNLLAIFVVDDQAVEYVLTVMNLLLSVVLFLDFVQRFVKAPGRGVTRAHYFFREFGWADLAASLPLPQLKILRVFRLWKAYRLFRRYGAKHLARTLLDDRAGSALYLLLIIAVLVLQFGSLWMLRIEQAAQGANITSASDAIWYVIVTISTVGYGDQFPVTNPGRVLGATIIILGVGIFGTLTGYLANAFIAPRKKTAAEEAEEDAEAAADASRDAEGHQRLLPHRFLDPGPQGGVEVIEQLLQLVLQGPQIVGHLMGLLAGVAQQLLQLLADPAAGQAGLAADHLDDGVEAAAGGLQGVARHLRPLALDRGQQSLETVPEGGLLGMGAGGMLPGEHDLIVQQTGPGAAVVGGAIALLRELGVGAGGLGGGIHRVQRG